VTQQVLKKISSEREDMESRSGARNELERTTSPEDTMELMSAISYGHNLRPMTATSMPMPSPTSNSMSRPGGPSNLPPGGVPAKAISAIKTNIKAATQVHPYQRN
jgi:mediator of RNA polymerase II transcription subunit 8